MMKRNTILAVLLCGSAWGFSEVFLGEALYRADVPFSSSVPLCAIGFVLLTLMRRHAGAMGMASLVGLLAAGYKFIAMYSHFIQTPVYICHVLAIVLLGVSYDVCMRVMGDRSAGRRAVAATAATYVGYFLFAVAITFVVRYENWLAGGWPKIIRHTLVSGSIAAAINAVLVPLTAHIHSRVGRRELVWRYLAVPGVPLAVAGLWAAAIVFTF